MADKRFEVTLLVDYDGDVDEKKVAGLIADALTREDIWRSFQKIQGATFWGFVGPTVKRTK